MTDSYGDGWQGASINIYVDGVMVDSGLPDGTDGQAAGTFYVDENSADGGETESVANAFCIDLGQDLLIETTDDLYDWEVYYRLLTRMEMYGSKTVLTSLAQTMSSGPSLTEPSIPCTACKETIVTTPTRPSAQPTWTATVWVDVKSRPQIMSALSRLPVVTTRSNQMKSTVTSNGRVKAQLQQRTAQP